ncbi:hypothetical protein P3S68_012795 [Capsicum galapagoense]
MSEEEMVSVFSRVQEGEYYTKFVSAVRATFTDLVKIGESLKEGIRTGKIAKAPTSSESSAFSKKKREDVTAVSTDFVDKSKRKFKPRNILSSPPSPNFQPVFYAHP